VLAPREAVRTEDGAPFVVSKGLAGGEALVIAGDTDSLREGQRVEVPDAGASTP
jgi:hypothetical protein